jgi:DNA-binding protein YbaB
MVRPLALLVCYAYCFAQAPADLFNKPPADVDRALRARISEFYQDHVDGKFRQAEALVAEDTKDFYFAANKPKYLSFEIQRIDYSEGFTRAKATILCEQYVMMPGFTDKPLKVPTPSTWKLVDGQWYWYVDQDALRQSPFGKMTPGPMPQGAAPHLPAIPNGKDMAFIFTQVKTDKPAVSLKTGAEEQVTLTNSAQGLVTLQLTGKLPGVDVKLDRMNLGAGEKAILTIHAGNDAKAGVLSVRVEQTNQVIPVQVKIE